VARFKYFLGRLDFISSFANSALIIGDTNRMAESS